MILMFTAIYILLIRRSTELNERHDGFTRSIEDLSNEYESDKNSMIALPEIEEFDVYEDFYDELNNWVKTEASMDIIFFGPTISFLRLDSETVLHILIHTRKYMIPISRALLAWDLITDGKTAAFLQGREFKAFGSLLNVIPEEDLYYVNFGDPSVMTYFSNYNLELASRKVGILVAAYRRYFGNTWFTNGSFINELGYMLCGFPSVDLNMIKPEVFREISVDALNKLKKCSVAQIQTLYNIATDPETYGKPYKWTSHEITRLSLLLTCVPEDEISSLQLEAIGAISKDVMKQINQNKLEYFTKQQVLKMNPKTRRLYIIRMQLKSSLDMSQLSKKYAVVIKPSLVLFLLDSVVTLRNI